MPVVHEREYRSMAMPLALVQSGGTKRLVSDYYVEGYASTFDEPYLMYEWDGVKYYEVVDRNAFAEADLSDVIMQYNHEGMVYARNMMARGKNPTLLVEPHESGLFIAADLGLTEESRALYDTIDKGLVYKMSYAFRVSEDAYNQDTHTRTILKIKKVYDVSAVSYPANAGTDITARSYFNGVIEVERREALARRAKLISIKMKLEE